MQSLVEGDIEEYMPFEDEVAIICNDAVSYTHLRGRGDQRAAALWGFHHHGGQTQAAEDAVADGKMGCHRLCAGRVFLSLIHI